MYDEYVIRHVLVELHWDKCNVFINGRNELLVMRSLRSILGASSY